MLGHHDLHLNSRQGDSLDRFEQACIRNKKGRLDLDFPFGGHDHKEIQLLHGFPLRIGAAQGNLHRSDRQLADIQFGEVGFGIEFFLGRVIPAYGKGGLERQSRLPSILRWVSRQEPSRLPPGSCSLSRFKPPM